MKKTLLISSVLLLPACVQPHPAYAAHHHDPIPTQVARRGQYLALPGQEAVRVHAADTDAAFDRQVAAYQTGTPAPTEQLVVDNGGYPAPQPDMQTVPQPDLQPATQTAPVVITQPQPQADPYAGDAATGMPAPTAPVATAPTAPIATAPTAAAPSNPAATGNMDYTVKVTNNTNGRIYVEAHDASGDIYPCGFMWGGKSYTTTKEKSAPIKGPITVVVRDPDQPGAPELRRYKVDPPADYNHKTVGINILSGGMYQVTLDGQECYTSPAPEGAKPAEAPAPAPGPAPAAPAPEPTPAGA